MEQRLAREEEHAEVKGGVLDAKPSHGLGVFVVVVVVFFCFVFFFCVCVFLVDILVFFLLEWFWSFKKVHL